MQREEKRAQGERRTKRERERGNGGKKEFRSAVVSYSKRTVSWVLHIKTESKINCDVESEMDAFIYYVRGQVKCVKNTGGECYHFSHVLHSHSSLCDEQGTQAQAISKDLNR